MIVDRKGHEEIFQHKGRQGPNMRPRESFFFSELRKFFFAKDLAKDFNMRPPGKINMVNVGFAKDSQKQIVYSQRMAGCRRRIWMNRNIHIAVPSIQAANFGGCKREDRIAYTHQQESIRTTTSPPKHFQDEGQSAHSTTL